MYTFNGCGCICCMHLQMEQDSNWVSMFVFDEIGLINPSKTLTRSDHWKPSWVVCGLLRSILPAWIQFDSSFADCCPTFGTALYQGSTWGQYWFILDPMCAQYCPIRAQYAPIWAQYGPMWNMLLWMSAILHHH